MKKSIVNCDVTNCKYNNKINSCKLKELSISSLGRGIDCNKSSSTVCQSFESSGGLITDNEYEIASEFWGDEISGLTEKRVDI